MDRNIPDGTPPQLDFIGGPHLGTSHNGDEESLLQSSSESPDLTHSQAHGDSSASESEYQHALEVCHQSSTSGILPLKLTK